MHISRGIILLALVQGLAACGGRSATSPTAPTSPTATPATAATPNGALIMKGTVSDTAFRSLVGARVEVLDGPQSGMTTTSDARGEFSLSGVFDDTTRFHATKEGYAAAVGTMLPSCAVCNPNRWIHFGLEVLAPAANLAGDYALTFVADSRCTDLPSAMRTRTYAVTIPSGPNGMPANAYFNVTARGATFYGGWNQFGLGIAGNRVGLWFEILAEQIAANEFLVFNMSAETTVTTPDVSTIDAVADGRLDYCIVNPEKGRFEDCFGGPTIVHATCSAGTFILTRR